MAIVRYSLIRVFFGSVLLSLFLIVLAFLAERLGLLDSTIQSILPSLIMSVSLHSVSSHITFILQGVGKPNLALVLRQVAVPLIIVVLMYSSNEKNLALYCSLLLASCLITALVSFGSLMLLTDFRTCKSNSISTNLKTNIRDSLPYTFPISIMNIITQWAAPLVIGMFGSASGVAIYTVAFRLASVLGFVFTAISFSSMRDLAVFYKDRDLYSLHSTIRYVTLVSLGFALLMFFVMILLGRNLLGLFDAEYEVGYLALIFLSVGQLVNIAAGPIAHVQQMLNVEKGLFWSLLLSNMVLIVCGSFMTFFYDWNGYAFSMVLAFALLNGLGIFNANKNLNMDYLSIIYRRS